MTIRTRLTLWYSTLLATVIIVFGLSLFTLLKWAWTSQAVENMKYVAEKLIAENVFDDGGSMTRPQVPKKYYSYGIQVWRADGLLLAWTENMGMTESFDAERMGTPEETWRERTLPDGTHALVLTHPVFSRAEAKHIGAVQIASPLTTIDDATERLLKVMLGVGIVALLLSFMVGMVIAGQALQPIEAITGAARQITAADDLSKRIPYEGPQDELGDLTATFNATLERLERLFNSQRRFVADVSHELRTPLTTIQGNLDLVRRWGNDPASLEAMESEVKRMTRLVGDLLLLAQADSGQLPLVDSVVELGSLALEVYRQAQVLTREVTLKLGTVEAVRVQGDPDRLKQLLLNLVTNAIKYTLPGGEVNISVTARDGFAFLTVRDTGIGIPKEDLPFIFDRFYRVDKARARKMGGAGLGLSIARWIAEAHRGRIWAESAPGKGSTFTVQLPSLDAAGPPDSMRETRSRLPILRRPRPAQEPPRTAAPIGTPPSEPRNP